MSTRPKILLLGQDPHVRMLRKQILKRDGFIVTARRNLNPESLIHSASFPFDGVVLDYSIRESERRQLMLKIRETHPELPVLSILESPWELDPAATRFIYWLDGPKKMLQALREMLSSNAPSDSDTTKASPDKIIPGLKIA